MRTIFYADDDADDRQLFAELVEELMAGVTVILAEDGKKLVTLLTDNNTAKPDLIFLDINMPVMNGYETLDAVREDPASKNIPVIILTTSTAEEDRQRMYIKGVDYYIPKPDSRKVFRELLSSLLSEVPVKKR